MDVSKLENFLFDTLWEFLCELMDSPGYFVAYLVIVGLETWASLGSFDTSRLDDSVVMSWLPLIIFIGAFVWGVDAGKRGITRLSIAATVFMAIWGASAVPFQEVYVWRYLLAAIFGGWLAHKIVIKAKQPAEQEAEPASSVEFDGGIAVHAN